jgi:hypothetical protein
MKASSRRETIGWEDLKANVKREETASRWSKMEVADSVSKMESSKTTELFDWQVALGLMIGPVTYPLCLFRSLHLFSRNLAQRQSHIQSIEHLRHALAPATSDDHEASVEAAVASASPRQASTARMYPHSVHLIPAQKRSTDVRLTKETLLSAPCSHTTKIQTQRSNMEQQSTTGTLRPTRSSRLPQSRNLQRDLPTIHAAPLRSPQ